MAIEATKQNTKSRLWNLVGMAAITVVMLFTFRQIPKVISWWTSQDLDTIGDMGWEVTQKNIYACCTETMGIWFSILLAYLTRTMLPDNAFGPTTSRWAALYFLYLLCYCLVVT